MNGLICEIDRSAIEQLKRHPAIEEVIPDMVITLPPTGPRIRVIELEPQPTLTDPKDIRLLSYTGPVTVRWNNLEAGLNSKAAWDRYDVSGKGVKIAFLETAVNYTLPDLIDNYIGGTDFIEDDEDPVTQNPDDWHGTEVVSLAVGKGVNKIVGVAYNAGYYVVRVGDESSKVLISDTISGIEWASQEPNKADIINMSFVTFGSEDPASPTFAVRQLNLGF